MRTRERTRTRSRMRNRRHNRPRSRRSRTRRGKRSRVRHGSRRPRSRRRRRSRMRGGFTCVTKGDQKWQPDDSVTYCPYCREPFGKGRGKHHCRKCGGIYCQDCMGGKMKCHGEKNAQFMCKKCHEMETFFQTLSTQKNDPSLGSMTE